MRRLFSGIATVTAAILVMALLSGVPKPAIGAPLRTFYVATTGDDTANGSSATPWKTLQRAARRVTSAPPTKLTSTAPVTS